MATKDLIWEARRIKFALDDRGPRLKKESEGLLDAIAKSQRLVIATLALWVMLIAVHLQQQVQLDDIRNGNIGQLIQLLDDVR